MTKLSEWLDIMLGEIARKQDDAARAVAEQALRDVERKSAPAAPIAPAQP